MKASIITLAIFLAGCGGGSPEEPQNGGSATCHTTTIGANSTTTCNENRVTSAPPVAKRVSP